MSFFCDYVCLPGCLSIMAVLSISVSVCLSLRFSLSHTHTHPHSRTRLIKTLSHPQQSTYILAHTPPLSVPTVSIRLSISFTFFTFLCPLVVFFIISFCQFFSPSCFLYFYQFVCLFVCQLRCVSPELRSNRVYSEDLLVTNAIAPNYCSRAKQMNKWTHKIPGKQKDIILINRQRGFSESMLESVHCTLSLEFLVQPENRVAYCNVILKDNPHEPSIVTTHALIQSRVEKTSG